jgi:hypothetical protein
MKLILVYSKIFIAFVNGAYGTKNIKIIVLKKIK